MYTETIHLITQTEAYKTGNLTYLPNHVTGLREILLVSEGGLNQFSNFNRELLLIEDNIQSNTFNLGTKKGKHIQIGNLDLEYIGAGSQSRAFKFQIGDRAYVLKVGHTTYYPITGAVGQPYPNEMMQLIELQQTYGEALNSNNIYIPEIYLATSEFMISDYIEGTEPKSIDPNYLNYIKGTLSDCISQGVHTGSSIWAGVVSDIKPNNLIETSNGTLFIVDAFRISQREHMQQFGSYYNISTRVR